MYLRGGVKDIHCSATGLSSIVQGCVCQWTVGNMYAVNVLGMRNALNVLGMRKVKQSRSSYTIYTNLNKDVFCNVNVLKMRKNMTQQDSKYLINQSYLC